MGWKREWSRAGIHCLRKQEHLDWVETKGGDGDRGAEGGGRDNGDNPRKKQLCWRNVQKGETRKRKTQRAKPEELKEEGKNAKEVEEQSVSLWMMHEWGWNNDFTKCFVSVKTGRFKEDRCHVLPRVSTYSPLCAKVQFILLSHRGYWDVFDWILMTIDDNSITDVDHDN